MLFSILTLSASALIAVGLAFIWVNAVSLRLWLWTLGRPTDKRPFKFSPDEQHYSGELFPTLTATSIKGGEVEKVETIPAHDSIYSRTEVMRGVRGDLIRSLVGICLLGLGVFVCWRWAVIPGTHMTVVFALAGLTIGGYFHYGRVVGDVGYPEDMVLRGLAKGGAFMAISGSTVIFGKILAACAGLAACS